MKLVEGVSRTKAGMVLDTFLTDENGGVYAAWLVREGETETTNQPGTPVHGRPIGTIATTTMLALMEWDDEAAS